MANRPQATRRQRWAPYVRQLGDILRLRDWRLDVAEEPPNDPTAVAACNPCVGRKIATLYLSEIFFGDEPAEQRHTITHELIHVHLGPMTRMTEARDYRTPEWTIAMEYGVDGLADAIAPLLPLPPASTRSQH
jgi:hypothetical protein